MSDPVSYANRCWPKMWRGLWLQFHEITANVFSKILRIYEERKREFWSWLLKSSMRAFYAGISTRLEIK